MPRRILAVICLVLYAATGQLEACACENLPVSSECESHDHQHEDPAAERHCDCPTCHPCSHVPVVLDAMGLHAPLSLRSGPHRIISGSKALPLVVTEIFIPPRPAA